jgi:hypothetical protein
MVGRQASVVVVAVVAEQEAQAGQQVQPVILLARLAA